MELQSTCVYFHKASIKWRAIISIEGKLHAIGYYDNEEEAAIDYARAVSKYCQIRAHQQWNQKFIDLTDVPL
jgi:hypothetical protein